MKKITFKVMSVLMASLSVFGVSGQTTLISPTAAGGFENGPLFTDNGWTVVNTNVLNGARWYMGATPLVSGAYMFMPSGTNCAYLSSNGGVSWSYSTPSVATSTSHIYRSVTFPAGHSSTLSFKVNANGQNQFDELLVYLCPSTVTPLADSPSGSSTVPTWSGVGGTPVLLGSFSGLTDATNITLPIDVSVTGNCASATSWNLVFSWKNDNLTSSNPPAAIDNVSLVSASPATIVTGTYTIDNTLPTAGSNFNNFTDAITALNKTGICSSINGPVIFNVSAGQTFNEQPPAIVATGTAVNTITFQKSGSGANPVIVSNGFNTQIDAVIRIFGGDYFVFDGIDINASNSLYIDYGYNLEGNSVINNGCKFNTIKNFNVSMNRLNNLSCALRSTANGTSSTLNSNSNNSILNFNIRNSAYGIYMVGLNNPKDVNNIIGTTNCSIFNSIGDPLVEGDITNYGIRTSQQNGISIFNNEIQNVSGNQVSTDGYGGIKLLVLQGVNSIFNNKIHNIKSDVSSTLNQSCGIEIVPTNSGSPVSTNRIYNNSIYDINSGYTGTSTNSMVIHGIKVVSGFVGATFKIDNNSVSINGSSSIVGSSACLSIDSISVYEVSNNVFANFTPIQTSLSKHLGLYSLSSTKFGATGSLSKSNDIYVENGVGSSGFVAGSNSTNYANLTSWSAAVTPIGQEAGSISANPLFVGNLSDLHSTSIALNNSGATLQSYITNDIECIARTDNDMGAYVVVPCTGTPSAGTISGLSSVCFGDSATLSLTGASNQAGITYQWAVSSVSGGPYTNSSSNGTLNTGAMSTPKYYVATVSCLFSGLSSVTPQKTINVTSSVNAGADQIICEGAGVVLTASGSSTYVWNSGTANGGTYFPAGTGIVTVTGITGQCTSTDEVLITVNAAPVVDAGNDFNACQGSSIVLAGSGANTYSWSNNVVNAQAFDANLTMTYFLTGTNANGCTDLDSILVTVLPSPVASATFVNSTLLFAGSTGLTYEWIDCSTNLPLIGQTNSYMDVTVNGSFAVVVTGQNGCTDTSNCLLVDYISVDEIEKNSYFNFYPNPVNDAVVINTEGSDLTINLLDAQGKQIGVFNNVSNGSKLNVGNLAPGVYFFKINTEFGSMIERFVKN